MAKDTKDSGKAQAKKPQAAPQAKGGGGRRDKGEMFETADKVITTEANRLRLRYRDEVVAKLRERFQYKNVMQVPRLEKVVINMGVSDAVQNPKSLDLAVAELALISGQRPLVTKARKSIAAFKLREGLSIGAKVTLRGDRMYVFLDKLFNVVLPRIRDFRGVSPKSFDGRGNYAMGLKEQTIFPEIEYDRVDRARGMDIIVVTTAQTDEEGLELMKALSCPMKVDEQR